MQFRITFATRLKFALLINKNVVGYYFQVFQHKEKISDISSQASNEATLEQMLQKVNSTVDM